MYPPYLPNSYAGATIFMPGTSYSTLTDSNGYWKLINIPNGVYNLMYAKPGYVRNIIYNIKIVSGSTLDMGKQYLGPVDPAKIIDFSATWDSTIPGRIQFGGTFSPDDSTWHRVLILVSNTKINVDSTFTFLDYFDPYEQYEGQAFSHSFKFQDFISYVLQDCPSIKMGDEIYFVAISVLYGNGSITTINPNTQQYEFNNPDVQTLKRREHCHSRVSIGAT